MSFEQPDPSMMQPPEGAPPGIGAPMMLGDDDRLEVEARDRVSTQLLLSAEDLCKGALLAAQSRNDGDAAAKFASAALDLVKAHVLLAPIEAADDLTQASQSTKPKSSEQSS